jgi:Crp-like helix-turn-helix domain
MSIHALFAKEVQQKTGIPDAQHIPLSIPQGNTDIFIPPDAGKIAQQKKNVIVNLPYDKSLIARRLNIQPETFSRALTQLKPHGVSMAKRQITIKDTDHLADFCDLDDRDRPC